jgi:anti-anti-sigma regulatory factor
MENDRNRLADFDDHETAVVREDRGDCDVVHIFGEFTFLERMRIEDALVCSVRIGRRTICNLLGVSYLDAAGAGVLIRAREALGSAFTVVVPRTGIVRRILEILDVSVFEDERLVGAPGIIPQA